MTDETNAAGGSEVAPAILRIEADGALPEQAGGKALGLQSIMRAGLRVPAAWVVLPGADEHEIEAFATALRDGSSGTFAVRSSALGEDDARHSFAGVHESRLAVPVEDLPAAVREVAGSALSDRARAYRDQVGLEPATGPCAVVVQQMAPGQVSGIAFGVGTCNDRVMIEAVEGLGELAVQGRVTPETVQMRRSGDAWLIERRKHRLQAEALFAEDGGLSQVAIPPELQAEEVLSADCAREVAAGVRALQKTTGHRLDVEWTSKGGEVYFLQARPQSRPVGDEIPPGQTWGRVNIREVLPGIPSAFTRSVVGAALKAAEHEFFRRHGLRLDPETQFVAFVYGRPVFNEAGFVLVDMLGASRQELQANLGGSGKPGDDFVPMNIWRALRHPLVLARALAIAAAAERRATQFIERQRAERSERTPIDIETASDEDLFKLVWEAYAVDGHNYLVHILSVVAALAGAQSDILATLRHCPSPRSLLTQLVVAGEGSVTTRQLEDLVAIARACARWPGAADFFDRTSPDHASIEYWEAEIPHDLFEMVRTWIDRYGHRGPCESEISAPRYRDDMRLLARALAPLMSSAATLESPEESLARRERDASAAWSEVARHVGPIGRWRVRFSVRRVKRLQALRELLRSEAMANGYPVRSILLELGRWLAERGRLERAEDVWHLSAEQLRTAKSNPDFDSKMAVARERSRIAAWRRIDVPNRFTSEEVEEMGLLPTPDAAPSEQLRGDGISPGVAEGRVCVLRSAAEGDRFENGSILVAPATDPGWTPIFARAIGIVVELGGMLSHAGIVAREYGIPSVSNIDGATRKLSTGDLIRIDGSQGLITVLSTADDSNPLPIEPGGGRGARPG
jgi:pyruvate,water dikinase